MLQTSTYRSKRWPRFSSSLSRSSSRMSWSPRSKNFSRSMSTTHQCPASTWPCAAFSAWCAHLPAHHRHIDSTTLRTSMGLQRYGPPHLCHVASHVVLVHRCSVLLLASSRLSLAADALAFQTARPLAGRAADSNHQVNAPYGAHQQKRVQAKACTLEWKKTESV